MQACNQQNVHMQLHLTGLHWECIFFIKMVIKYSHKSRHATYIGFALSLLTCPGLITITSCENIYVSPLLNESCPAEPCLMISQLAANTSNYLDSNSIVTILPGNHSLYYKLVIENVSTLTIIANSAPALRATVTCTNCTGLCSRIFLNFI